MSKIRVYELARELNIESKVLLNSIKAMGINVLTHQSTLTEEEVERIKGVIKGDVAANTLTTDGGTLSVAAKDKSGAVKVIRRRRTVTSTEEKDSAVEIAGVSEVSTRALPLEDKTKQESKEHQELQQTDVADKITQSDDSATMPEPVSSTSSNVELISTQKIEEYKVSEGISEKEKTLSSTVSDTQKLESEKKEKSAFKSGTSATIVRRAAIISDTVSADNQQTGTSVSKDRTIKKEDSKGMKFTGIGSPSARARLKNSLVSSFSEFETQDNIKAPSSEKGDWKKADKLKIKSYDDSDEIKLKKKFLIKGRKNEQINTKVLLRNLDLFDEEDYDDDELDNLTSPYGEEYEESKVYIPKTVYTPTSTFRKKDLKRKTNLKKTQITVAREAYRTIKMKDTISVAELAKNLKVKASELISKLMQQGIMANINDNIDYETAVILAADYNYEVKQENITVDDILGLDQETLAKAQWVVRPPIVTVMGHVDHGKTSILDAIRNTNVAQGEAGGITQHIGAYTVNYQGKIITFLDTPGHEAFSAMRARGANVTDIVVLVVAADDGVKPQTVEAISHAKAAGVPIIVAINKIDKEGINLDKIYQELAQYEIQSEEWGGENVFVKVSALKKQGIDELLQAILLISELSELKARINIPARGVVIETKLDSGKGPVATVIVKEGVLKKGELIVVGTLSGRVRTMYTHTGEQVEEASVSIPVQIVGLDDIPQAGDSVYVVKNDKMADELIEWIKENQRKTQTESLKGKSLEELLEKMKTSSVPELSIILKTDTHGSLEAISEALSKLNTEKVRNKIIHKGIGGISESDVMLASTSGAVIIGFNVRPARGVDDIIEKQGVPVKYFSIIYELIDAVKSMMAGKLPPILQEEVIGHAEVRQPFVIPKVGTIAGSTVTDGKIVRNAYLRLIRDSVVIYSGKISSLRRFKDDVKEVKSGYECGIGIENYNDIKAGDVIEAYIIKEVPPTL